MIDEAKLKEWEALAEGADHLEILLRCAEHVFISALNDRDKAAPDELPPPRRVDWNVNAKTVALIMVARTAVPALIEEVRRLQAVAIAFEDEADRLGGEVKEAREAVAVAAPIVVTGIGADPITAGAIRRAERERCAEVTEILKMRAGDEGQEAMVAEICEAIRALPDEP